MIREININEIYKFIDFGNSLYKNDINYVPFMRKDLYKTIKKLVFIRKTYKALCSFDDKGKVNGRILLTVGSNKQLNTNNCGYFSHLEVVDDEVVFKELMDKAIITLKEMNAKYILGSFFFHDPDNRRGILIQGYELAPMIFTSYNPKYYQGLFENYGFLKLTDAYEYEYKENKETLEKIKNIASKAIIENDIHIDKLNLKNIDKEIEDVHTIMVTASTKINFENVISKEKIRKIFLSMKNFIDPDYAFIARTNKDNSPIGFTFTIPNYNEIIKKMNGRLNLKSLFIFMFKRKKITSLRAMLQYIIPNYQHKGISKALYYETKKSIDNNNIKRISLGTIMEANINSNGSIISLGGELSKIYRIYYKEI